MMVKNRNNHIIDFSSSIELMDDEIREALANDGKERTEQEFFWAYEKAHAEKHGEEWELSKANPTW